MAHDVVISWTAAPGPIDGYNVYRGTAHGNEVGPPLNGNTPVVVTTYTDTAVFPGQTYSYAVRSTYHGIESANSIDIVSAPVPFAPSPPHLSPNIDGAASFGILASSTVTNTGTSNVNGDVGVSPGTAITGFGPPSSISGVFHSADFVAANAQAAITAAVAQVHAMAGAVAVPADIGGMTFFPGLYTAASSLTITGNVTLDAQGNPNAVFIFETGSTLLPQANSGVLLMGGASAANVFWVVGSSATINAGANFAGDVLAAVSITVDAGAYVNGRLFAQTGAVTLISDNIVEFQACTPVPLPPSPPNTPPAPPAAPTNVVITSEV